MNAPFDAAHGDMTSRLREEAAIEPDAPRAYQTAFDDPTCLKMVLDWRHAA